MEFGVLGPLEVTAHGQPLLVRGTRTRAVLAMLLVYANQVVPAGQLVDELWPGQATDRASASLQVRVSELRKAFRSAQEADRLVTRPPGYLIRVQPEELDTLRFDRLTAEGEAALAAGDAGFAARRLDEALSLWRGRALADVDASPFAQAEVARLEERRMAALESRAEALLVCGRHRELIGDLETLTAAYPLRERLWSQRMLALYRAGRQADALRAYRDLRAILVSELGIEPGPALADLEGRILRQDPGLARPPGRGAASEPDAPPPTQYAQSDDGVHIAYQVLGEGELDIVAVPGLISHLDLWWEDRSSARFFRRLASLGRLIMFDKRDTGLSDRAAGEDTLEQRIDDVRAVMRACGSDGAALFGYSEGSPMSILFAATYPERVPAGSWRPSCTLRSCRTSPTSPPRLSGTWRSSGGAWSPAPAAASSPPSTGRPGRSAARPPCAAARRGVAWPRGPASMPVRSSWPGPRSPASPSAGRPRSRRWPDPARSSYRVPSATWSPGRRSPSPIAAVIS
ncbi:MAG: alpha/beta fold hydrolase [Streptosporangiaceae bacterium]